MQGLPSHLQADVLDAQAEKQAVARALLQLPKARLRRARAARLHQRPGAAAVRRSGLDGALAFMRNPPSPHPRPVPSNP